MTKKFLRKRNTEKTTSDIQALDDEALKGIVGGTGHDDQDPDNGEDDDEVFWGESPGPDWD